MIYTLYIVVVTDVWITSHRYELLYLLCSCSFIKLQPAIVALLRLAGGASLFFLTKKVSKKVKTTQTR
ncbi:hypothetical protein OB13_00600 [Pontibacter sp. HJ8]